MNPETLLAMKQAAETARDAYLNVAWFTVADLQRTRVAFSVTCSTHIAQASPANVSALIAEPDALVAEVERQAGEIERLRGDARCQCGAPITAQGHQCRPTVKEARGEDERSRNYKTT